MEIVQVTNIRGSGEVMRSKQISVFLGNQQGVEIMLQPCNIPPINVRCPQQDGSNGVHVSKVGRCLDAINSVAESYKRCLNHEATCFGRGPVRKN